MISISIIWISSDYSCIYEIPMVVMMLAMMIVMVIMIVMVMLIMTMVMVTMVITIMTMVMMIMILENSDLFPGTPPQSWCTSRMENCIAQNQSIYCPKAIQISHRNAKFGNQLYLGRCNICKIEPRSRSDLPLFILDWETL